MIDYWEEAITRHFTQARLPKGFEVITGMDGETIYRDADFNEYLKDEYGNFVRID